MATVRDIASDADLFRASYPHWPHPEPGQPTATRVPLSGDPFERHAIAWHDGTRPRLARFNTDAALARFLAAHRLTLGAELTPAHEEAR